MTLNPRLILIRSSAAGTIPGTIYPLTAGETVLGRSETCEIPIESPSISRHHARLTRQDDDFMLDDLGSTIGTFVNDSALGRLTHRLVPGDQIRLGRDTVFEFQA